MYHGWKIVGAAFLIAVFGWGFGFYGIGVFLGTLVEQHGRTTSSVASAVTVLYLVGAALIACAASAFERFGPRRVVLVAIAAMGTGAVALTCITEPWQLYLVFPLMAVGWAGMSGATLNIIVAPWFERRRDLAISIAFNGAAPAVSLTSIAAVRGRLIVGLFVDRVNRRAVVASNFLLQAAAVTLMLAVPAPALLYVACVMFGLGVGNTTSLPSMVG